MASVCGFSILCGGGGVCSLRFSQEVFYHLHLPWCQHSLILSIPYGFEGIEEASGLAQFLAEEVDGSLVRQMRVVEHGKAAEVVSVNRRLPHNRL